MFEPGTQIGQWKVERLLGEGGMGAVYRAHDVSDPSRLAAVKVMKPDVVGDDDDAAKRFLREVQMLQRLAHESIVEVYDGGQCQRTWALYMALELLEGEELEQRLERGPLPHAEAAAAFRSLSLGLKAAHDQGIVHRDIKPANLFFCRDGRVKLLDFGVALQKGESRLTRFGMVPGTLAYMAPEVFQGEEPDLRADIYALGLTLYQALTGKPVFGEGPGGKSLGIAEVTRAKLGTSDFDPGPDFPDALRAAVRGATNANVNQRYQDLGELAAELGKVEAPKAPSRSLPPVPTPREETTRAGGGSSVAIVAGGVVALGVAAVALIVVLALVLVAMS